MHPLIQRGPILMDRRDKKNIYFYDTYTFSYSMCLYSERITRTVFHDCSFLISMVRTIITVCYKDIPPFFLAATKACLPCSHLWHKKYQKGGGWERATHVIISTCMSTNSLSRHIPLFSIATPKEEWFICRYAVSASHSRTKSIFNFKYPMISVAKKKV